MTSGDAVCKVVADAVTAGVNAGMAVTQTARARAEELVGRGRSSSEHVAALVRKEIAAQLAQMGLATKTDLADLEARLRSVNPAANPAANPAGSPAPRAGKPAAARPPRRRPPAGSS